MSLANAKSCNIYFPLGTKEYSDQNRDSALYYKDCLN